MTSEKFKRALESADNVLRRIADTRHTLKIVTETEGPRSWSKTLPCQCVLCLNERKVDVSEHKFYPGSISINAKIIVPFAVTALVINEVDQILSVSRKDNHTDFGLPGGKIEPNELPEVALKRELCEETGLIVEEMHELFNAPTFSERDELYCTTFYVTKYSGVPQSLEGAVVTWLDKNELVSEKSSFANYNKRLFEHIKMTNVVHPHQG